MECLLNSNAMMGHLMNGRVGRGLCFLDLGIWFDWIMHDHASIPTVSSEALTPHLLTFTAFTRSACPGGR